MAIISRKKASSMTKMEDQWRTEEDLRCLQVAAEIRKDPKRLAKCRALAREKLAAAQKTAESIAK